MTNESNWFRQVYTKVCSKVRRISSGQRSSYVMEMFNWVTLDLFHLIPTILIQIKKPVMPFHGKYKKVLFTNSQLLLKDITDPMETVTSMVLYFRKLQQKASRMLLLQSALPGAALLNELIVYIWSSAQRRGRSRNGVEKQEKQSRIFRRCYTSTGHILWR